jgi:hypothetical protein
MEHLVRSLATPDDLISELGDAFEEGEEEEQEVDDEVESNGKLFCACQLRMNAHVSLKVAFQPVAGTMPSVSQLPALKTWQTAILRIRLMQSLTLLEIFLSNARLQWRVCSSHMMRKVSDVGHHAVLATSRLPIVRMVLLRLETRTCSILLGECPVFHPPQI